MRHLSILIPEGTLILDTVVRTLNLFKMANSYAKKIGLFENDVFSTDLVKESMEPITYHRHFQIMPTRTFDQIEKSDLIIITSIIGDLKSALNKSQRLIKWVRDQRVRNSSEVVSLCRSAFILAETGLLHGKSCATHWAVHNLFETMYPKVDLLPDRIVSDDNGIYTSGGAYSFLNMIVYLVEKSYGRETAIWCSKMGEIDFDRVNQNQFIIFLAGKKDMEMNRYLKYKNTSKSILKTSFRLMNLQEFL